MSELLAALSSARDSVWTLWETAVKNRSGPGQIAVLATVRHDYGASARMLVLRGASRSNETLTFWTNAASAKVREVENTPCCELLFWIPEMQSQIRVNADITTDEGDPDVWSKLDDATRRNYADNPKPGTILKTPEDAFKSVSIANFLMITAHVARIDVLCLNSSPHRRVLITGTDSQWIAP